MKRLDQSREERLLNEKRDRFAKDLTSEIGLRWIAEALCPAIDKELSEERCPPNAFGNLADVIPWFPPLIPTADEDSERYRNQHAEILCQERGTFLVGHNVFLDLIYFYTCFFGPLPDRVEDFQRIIGRLFNMVFDTKYLADTVEGNSNSYNSSLQDVDRQLSELPFPVIGKCSIVEKLAYEKPALTVTHRGSTRP